MARKEIVFDDWARGDLGRHGPMAGRTGRDRGNINGHFRGVNVIRYANGTIGPRPALQLLDALEGLTLNGRPMFIEYAANIDLLYVVTSTGRVYKRSNFLTGGGAWSAAHTLGVTPLSTALYGNHLFVGAALGVYKLTNGFVQSGPFANSPLDCTHLVQYREFLVGHQDGSGEFAYSDPGDPVTWPAANLVQIGSGSQNIEGMFTQKNSLVNITSGGEWWTTSGFLGAAGSAGEDITRRADIGMAFAGFGTSVLQSSIWYVNGRDACVFTGAQVLTEPLPDVDTRTGVCPSASFPTSIDDAATLTPNGLQTLFEPNSFLLVASSTVDGEQKVFGFARHNNRGWSRHVFPIEEIANENLPVLKSTLNGDVYFFTYDDSAELHVYRWQPRQENVYSAAGDNPLDVDLDADSGDVVQGYLATPEWWTSNGSGVHVEGVIVDFEYDAEAIVAAVGGGDDPEDVVHFDITVEAVNNQMADGERTSATLSFDPPEEAASRTADPSGYNVVRRRQSFRFGDQGMGTGFQVILDNLRGVQVHRIIVIANVNESTLF